MRLQYHFICFLRTECLLLRSSSWRKPTSDGFHLGCQIFHICWFSLRSVLVIAGDIFSALTSAEHMLLWHLSLAQDKKYLFLSVILCSAKLKADIFPIPFSPKTESETTAYNFQRQLKLFSSWCEKCSFLIYLHVVFYCAGLCVQLLLHAI